MGGYCGCIKKLGKENEVNLSLISLYIQRRFTRESNKIYEDEDIEDNKFHQENEKKNKSILKGTKLSIKSIVESNNNNITFETDKRKSKSEMIKLNKKNLSLNENLEPILDINPIVSI